MLVRVKEEEDGKRIAAGKWERNMEAGSEGRSSFHSFKKCDTESNKMIVGGKIVFITWLCFQNKIIFCMSVI